MQQPSNDNSRHAPVVGTRGCPVCGTPMFLALIEPTYQSSYDVRTFECSKCAYAEIVLVNFDEIRGDEHASAGAIQHEIIKHSEENGSTKEEKEKNGR